MSASSSGNLLLVNSLLKAKASVDLTKTVMNKCDMLYVSIFSGQSILIIASRCFTHMH